VGIADRENGSDGRRVVVPAAEAETGDGSNGIVEENQGGKSNGPSPLAQSVVPEDVQDEDEEDSDDDKSGKGDGETDQLIKK